MNAQIIAQYETEIAEAVSAEAINEAALNRIELFASRCNEVAEYKQALINTLENIQ